jgi:hypothetical protein
MAAPLFASPELPRSSGSVEVATERSATRRAVMRREVQVAPATLLAQGLVMSKTIRPSGLGIRLSTYGDLEKIVHAFARGDLNLLILLGGPGLGKSRVLHQATAGQACCWLEGNTSPFGLYCQLWRNQNRPVVLDDLDGLYASRDGIRLLKCLANPHYTSEAERVRAFIAKGAGSRSTYFNLAKKLPPPTSVPHLQLKSRPPVRRADEEMARLLRRWRGHFGDN